MHGDARIAAPSCRSFPTPLARPFLFGLDPEHAHDLTLGGAGARSSTRRWSALIAAARVDDPVTLAGPALSEPHRPGRRARQERPLHRRLRRDGLRLRRGRHGHAAGAAGQPEAAHVPPARRRSALINRLGFNNDGLAAFIANVQAGALSRQRRHPRPQHRQERGDADRARRRRLPDRPRRRLSARRLRDGQHLEPEHRRTCARCKATPRSTPCSRALRHARAELADEHGRDGADVRQDRARPRRGAGRRDRRDAAAPRDRRRDRHQHHARARRGRRPARTARRAGGLSGAPLLDARNRVIAQLRAALGAGFPIIGVGGVMSGRRRACQARRRRRPGPDLHRLHLQGPGSGDGSGARARRP